jgi:hypothetical protein
LGEKRPVVTGDEVDLCEPVYVNGDTQQLVFNFACTGLMRRGACCSPKDSDA